MKLGAEKNKVILLGVVGTIACATVYTQFFSGPDLTPAARRPVAQRASTAPQRKVTRRQRPSSRPARGQTFRPSFGSGDDAGEPLDPMTVDPTLRTDLLAKVREVEFGGVERNIFRFGQRKPKPVAGPTPEELQEAERRRKETEQSNLNPPPPNPEPQVKTPKAPPIKWKYYGFANSSKDARKRAFLLGEEEEVFIATEGDIFEKRYRIVRIGVNSIVIEDMQFKAEQTLPLEES